MTVSGTLVPDWTGTLIGQGIYDGQPHWKHTVQDAWLWYHAATDTWYFNEYPGEYEDPDNLQWQRSLHDGPTGDYWSYVMHTASVPTPPVPTDYYRSGWYADKVLYLDATAQLNEIWWSAAEDAYVLTLTNEREPGAGDNWWKGPATKLSWGTFTAQGTAVGDVVMDDNSRGIATITKA